MTDPQASEPSHHRHEEAPPSGHGPWRLLFIIAVVVLGLVIVALVLWLVLRPGGSPTPTPSPTASSASAGPTPAPSPTSTGGGAVATCDTSNSSLSLGSPSGVAGSTVVPLVFTNTSSAPCTLQGFPAVEFVGGGNGTQIGAAARQDPTTAPVTLVTIAPGAGAGSVLTIADAGNVCSDQVAVDGFRVIPPGSNDAFFLPETSYPACQGDTSLLTVSAIAGP